MSEHDTLAHSVFGGSSADRWMNCAGSTALIATVPQPPSSSYAVEGTGAHALGEHCLSCDLEPDLFAGQDFEFEDHGEMKTLRITPEVVMAVSTYTCAVRDEMALASDAQLYVEKRFVLPISTAEPGEVFGSNDALVYIPSLRRLTVFDYKHGAGISVSADDNAQLKFYAAGAALTNDWPIATVDLVIVQPRARDAEDHDGGVKRWSMHPVDLIEFTAAAEAAIARAKQPDADLNPGKHCRWCAAAAVCPAKEQQALVATGLDFKDVTLVAPSNLPKPDTLDTERLGRVLAALDIIEDWGKQVREYVNGLLIQGVDVPGFKLVEKIGRRRWIDDETKIAGYLAAMHGLEEDDTRPRKLETITEIERQLKARITDKEQRKAALDDLSLAFTLKDSSGLTLVPSSDKRAAVNAVARDFGSVVDLMA